MGREVKRVPLDFDWPLEKVWEGFLMPERLHESNCTHCDGSGYSPRARHLMDQWYGKVPFRPEDNGSTPLTPFEPAVRKFAERNVENAPGFYGTGETAILAEATRLSALWNGMWCHHVNSEDVAALVAAGRLMDFTHRWSRDKGWQPLDPPVVPEPYEVNEWAIRSMGHDAINASVVVKARCAREGVADVCSTCDGHGCVEEYEGQRAEADAWKPTEPPNGEGWQLWETVSEGSPVSQVFGTSEELARWLTTSEASESRAVSRPMTIEQARGFVEAGWALSGVGNAGGYHDGADWVGSEAVLRAHETD